jgi:hypothetical protein
MVSFSLMFVGTKNLGILFFLMKEYQFLHKNIVMFIIFLYLFIYFGKTCFLNHSLSQHMHGWMTIRKLSSIFGCMLWWILVSSKGWIGRRHYLLFHAFEIGCISCIDYFFKSHKSTSIEGIQKYWSLNGYDVDYNLFGIY